MINDKLREFIERVSGSKYISADDVRDLHQNALAGGLASRIEVEALLALDRTVGADPTWEAALSRLVVDFVVRGRPSADMAGYEDALWLATALDIGGPTKTAMGIAYAILDELPRVDAALLDFIMRGRQQERLQNMAA